MDREQRRHAAAGLVDAPEEVAGALRRDHPDVDAARRVDPPEVDVEPVGEHQQLARPEVRRDLRVVDRLLAGVRDEDHDHVAPRWTASATSATRRPASSASGRLFDPGASPTMTSTPDSWRFSAWAWPCDP